MKQTQVERPGYGNRVAAFSGYAFVRVMLASPDRLRVLQTHGVAGFVGINCCGTAIPDSQIQDIRTLLASKVPFEEQPFLRVGQRVRIRGGSLDGVEGILSARNEDRSLVISLQPIQRSLSVRIQGLHRQTCLISTVSLRQKISRRPLPRRSVCAPVIRDQLRVTGTGSTSPA
jgi:transcription antitermination factor NusG